MFMDENLAGRLRKEESLSRREFIQRSAILTGSLTAAAAMTDSLGSSKAYAAQVEPNDPALASSDIKFNSTDGTSVSGYLTRPKGDGTYPAIVVIHENRGLNDHIRDVARRLAKAGYVALAPDLLSRQGGTRSFANDEAAIAAIGKLDEDGLTKDLTGAINYLKNEKFVRANKIGVVGFCWGGGNTLLIATRNKDLAAAVVYYGRNPKNLEDVKNINAAVLGNYGEKDTGITSQVPKLEEAMKQYGKSFEYKIYPGAPHAFNNDTNPERYNAEAAKEAWARTLDFFKKHLQS
jgi:carboxymethylenebutenolidase